MGLKLIPRFRIVGHEDQFYNRNTKSLVFTDNAGYMNDTLVITLSIDEHNHSITKGNKISLELGYEDEPLFEMGTFIVNKTKPLYLPKRLQVFATAAAQHINAKSKSRRSETYAGMTIGDIVARVAGRLGFDAKIHPKLTNQVIVHLDQKNESDLSFITRLASQYDAVAKVVDEVMIFSLRGQIKNLSGEKIEPIHLVVSDDTQSAPDNGLIEFEVELPETEQYMGVTADYVTSNNDIKTVHIGNNPRERLPGRFKDEKKATVAANAQLSRIKRNSLKGKFLVTGNPLIMSEMPIVITGADDDVDGDFSSDQITHRYDEKGYYTEGTVSAVIR